jgi:hypothetical protein
MPEVSLDCGGLRRRKDGTRESCSLHVAHGIHRDAVMSFLAAGRSVIEPIRSAPGLRSELTHCLRK